MGPVKAFSITFGFAVLLLGGASLLKGEEGAIDPQKAKMHYTIFCVSCHGEHGDGKGPVGVTLDPPPRDFTKGEWKFGGTDKDLFEVITNGAASKGGSPLMTPWGAVIPEADRWALVHYVRSLKKN
jgi:mono/diheme cytochrome c family protein